MSLIEITTNHGKISAIATSLHQSASVYRWSLADVGNPFYSVEGHPLAAIACIKEGVLTAHGIGDDRVLELTLMGPGDPVTLAASDFNGQQGLLESYIHSRNLERTYGKNRAA